MACTPIVTGDRFLLRVLDHIDCQAQTIGSYGYRALGEPGSTASIVVLALLTLFVALFAIRLLFGPGPGARDVVFDVLTIGIVLTLAFSWPAFRTLVYDLTLQGAGEIAATIAPGPSNAIGLAERLQEADTAMVRLTELGTGRNTGAFVNAEATGGTFQGSALADDSAFGLARLTYLAGIVGSLALLRIVAGVLLALAPLAAGLLLFEQTRGLFSGWLRGLVLALVGSIGLTVVLSVQLAILAPWLADALRLRGLGYAVPSAPIELFALNLAFALVQFAIIWLLAKVAFTRGWPSLRGLIPASERRSVSAAEPAIVPATSDLAVSRAQRISDSVETVMRREAQTERERIAYRGFGGSAGASVHASERVVEGRAGEVSGSTAPARLGSSYRRTARRSSQAAGMRDRSS